MSIDGAAWTARYGESPPADLPELDGLLAHRSVRDFVPHVWEERHTQLLTAAAQSASTSSNLQVWSAVAIRPGPGRDDITKLCVGQRQVAECGMFYAFLGDLHRSERLGGDPAVLGACETFTMAVVDASLAAERMAVAAERLGLGVCYIGALRDDPEGVALALGLPPRVFPVFGLAVGTPREPVSARVKPRLDREIVVMEGRYAADPSFESSDVRHAAFAAEEGMRGPGEWSIRSRRRLEPGALGPRAGFLGWLRSRGLLES